MLHSLRILVLISYHHLQVKIEDDDVAIWSIEDLAMNEGDSDTEMAFRVYLSTPVYETVRVKWTASTKVGNTATFGEDYAI